MPELREELRAAADPPPPDDFDRADLQRRMRRIRGLRRGLAAVMVLAVGVGGWMVTQRTPSDTSVEFIDRADPDRAVDEVRWSPLPKSPLTPRWGSYAAWTDEEFVVWGGYADTGTVGEESADDGAAYDPDTGHWRRIAQSPIPGMRLGRSVWTGVELWVLGGEGDPNGRTAMTAAAAYDPDTDSWRGLPDVPAQLHAAAWSPRTREAVVVGPGVGRSGPRGVWALGADDDRWRELPATPTLARRLDADHPELSLVAGDGTAYLVTTAATWRLNLRDPAGWARLPDRPTTDASAEAPRAVWTGAGLLTVGPAGSALYGPTADGDAWTTLPPPPISIDFDWLDWSLLTVHDGAVAVDLRAGTVAAFDVATARWSALPDVPLQTRTGGAVAEGTDGDTDIVFAWGGSDDMNLPYVDGAVLTVPASVDAVGDVGTAGTGDDTGVHHARSVPAQTPADVPVTVDAMNGGRQRVRW